MYEALRIFPQSCSTHLMIKYLLKCLFLTLLIQNVTLEASWINSLKSKNKSSSLVQQITLCENCFFYLGGLFPVHEPRPRANLNTFVKQANAKNESSDDYLVCGSIKKERGIQRLEAMLFAIDLINNSTELLPHTKLGAKIFDTCDRDTVALEKSMDFISDYFLLHSDNVANDFSCDAMGHVPKKRSESIVKRKVVGVIGAASSSVSIQIPQISYASTSPDLSDKERFPYFSRVLSPDTFQAKGMVSLVKVLQWNYVATLSEEGNLGGVDAFIKKAKNEKICISGSFTLSQTASEDDVQRIVLEMYKLKNSRTVVIFLQDHNIKKLLSAVESLELSEHFLWVASDSWGTKKESIGSKHSVAEGAITFSPKAYEIKSFNDYFKKLKPRTNIRNPWFNEFWESHFDCSLTNPVQNTKNLCTGEETLDVKQDTFIHFVVDSVFAMAHAIEKIIKTNCANYNYTELHKCEHISPIKGPELLEAIRNVEFQSITGRQVKFLKNKEHRGDGIISFEVFQYQYSSDLKYHYRKIAEWDSDRDIFNIDTTELRWKDGSMKIPKSVCKEDCKNGEIKQGDTCCWVCVKCEETEHTNLNRTKCVKCESGFGPNGNKTSCQKLQIEYMDWNSPFTYIPAIYSSIGIIFTFYTAIIFIKFNKTPIIKASGRELCYLLLAGIFLSYLVTFPLVIKPTVVSCLILRIGTSLSLTICLSALITKTNRLSRIFNSSLRKIKQPSFVSPKSQIVICFSIISVQLIGLLIWLMIDPSDLTYDYDDPKRVVLQCKTPNTHLIFSLFYNVILIIFCTIYAIKTRKIPENFNEARLIGFTVYSICIIWVAFIPIYFGTTAAAGSGKSYKNNFKIQLTTLAMCINLSATVILACLFIPKLKVVLLKPNKNIRNKSGNLSVMVRQFKSNEAKNIQISNNPENDNATINFDNAILEAKQCKQRKRNIKIFKFSRPRINTRKFEARIEKKNLQNTKYFQKKLTTSYLNSRNILSKQIDGFIILNQNIQVENENFNSLSNSYHKDDKFQKSDFINLNDGFQLGENSNLNLSKRKINTTNHSFQLAKNIIEISSIASLRNISDQIKWSPWVHDKKTLENSSLSELVKLDNTNMEEEPKNDQDDSCTIRITFV